MPEAKRNRTRGIALIPVVALIIIAADQIAKQWVVGNVDRFRPLQVIQGFLQLRYTENTGAAFGFLQGWTGPLSIAAVAIVVAILLSASQVSSGGYVSMLALGLVVGGALGNLVDRVHLGYVVDYVEVYGPHLNINNTVYTWPIFNVADSAISTGVVLLLITLFLSTREPQPTHAETEPRHPAVSDRSAWFERPGQEESGALASSLAAPARPLRNPTPAGWAGLVMLVAGFLFMALRTNNRSREV